MNLVLVGILVYVAGQLLVGFAVSSRVATEDDYLLAGRRLGVWLTTFSLFATWFGAETCIGSVGEIYEHGLSGGTADPFGYTLCLAFMGFAFAVPFWRRRLTTLADLYRDRYSTTVERLTILVLVPTSVFWGAAQIRAFGQVLAASSAIEVDVAITLATGVVIAYTVAGGMLADAVTDLIQGICIIVGLVALVVVVLPKAGGALAFWSSVPAERLRLLGGPERSWWEVANAWAIPVIGSVVTQELVSRCLAARSPEVAKKSCYYASGIYLAVGMVPVTLGMLGYHLVPGLVEPDQMLPTLAQRYLPPILYVVFAGALVSAILSTVDTVLLVSAAMISHNLVAPMRPNMTEAEKVRSARLWVVGLGVFAYFMALRADGIRELIVDSAQMGTAGIFVITCFGLFSNWGGPPSAIASLLAGIASWTYGVYVGEWACSFLVSLGAAGGAYVAVATGESLRRTIRARTAAPGL